MAKGKDKKDFKLYKDMISTFEDLSDEEAGMLIKHIFRYVSCLNPIPPNRIIKVAFESIRVTLERDLSGWKIACAKNAENANMRWHPTASDRMRTNAKHADSDSDSDSDREVYEKEYKERKVFKKPELDEVIAYFLNQEMPQNEAQSFHDYYEANGWKVGKNPMKNWMAAARNWKKNFKNYGREIKLGTSEARIAAIKNF